MIQFATICCVIQHTDHNSNNIVCNNTYMYFTVSQYRNIFNYQYSYCERYIIAVNVITS